MSNRKDWGKVLVVGPTGDGKSFIAKTANTTSTGLINAERQPLSFKADFKYHGRPKSWSGFLKNVEDYGKNDDIYNIIIDSQSMAFDQLHAEMSNNFKGYDIYSNYNRQLVKYFDILRNIEKDIIVLSHDETVVMEGYRQRRAKVQGKQFEGRVEAYFTIVLFTGKRIKDNKPEFFLKTFEPDTSTKVPEGMFGTALEIPNSAEFIFNAIETYYS
jgi:hypothetical protein